MNVELVFTESDGIVVIAFPGTAKRTMRLTATLKKAPPSEPQKNDPAPLGRYKRHPMGLIKGSRRTRTLGDREWSFTLTDPADWNGKGSKPGGRLDVLLLGAHMSEASVLSVFTLAGGDEELKPLLDDPDADVVLFYQNYG
jgi:hypothetical protein